MHFNIFLQFGNALKSVKFHCFGTYLQMILLEMFQSQDPSRSCRFLGSPLQAVHGLIRRVDQTPAGHLQVYIQEGVGQLRQILIPGHMFT